MFGYTVPSYVHLASSDRVTYQRYYCETCHQLRDGYGIASTVTVNNDMTFNTLVLNGYAGDVLDFEGTRHGARCIFTPHRADSDIFAKMAAYTVLLTKWELYDDKVDKPSLKTNLINLTLQRAISKAEKRFPEYDDVVGKGFEALRDFERQGCNDIRRMGRVFGESLAVALNDFAGDRANEHLSNVFIHLTEIVYFLDAVDDLEDDYMDGTYNPLLRGCDRFINKKDYISKNLYPLTDMANSIMSSLQTEYSVISGELRSCKGPCDNIVYYGLPESLKKVLSCTSTAKASLKNAFNGHKERNA